MTKWERFFLSCLAVAFIVVLGGCSTLKALSDACRDRMC